MPNSKAIDFFIEMSKSNTNTPAYPVSLVSDDGTAIDFLGQSTLTVVATAAMKGLMSNPVFVYNNTGHTPSVTMDYDLIAAMSVSAAKALISEIEKSK